MFKNIWVVLVFASIANSNSPFTGIWEGQMNDQPAIELTIRGTAGEIDGMIVFFFQRRGDDGKWRVEGGKKPTSLIKPILKGKSLTFEVTHHKHHGSPELGPNAKFRMELTGPDVARLFKTDEPPDGGPGLKLHRRKEH